MVVADGPRQLRELGLRLKVLGSMEMAGPSAALGKGASLRAQLLAGLKAAALPMTTAAKKRARDTLPRKGGLNTYIGDEKIDIRRLLAGSIGQVGVRIVPQSGAWAPDQVQVRHPVPGTVGSRPGSKKWRPTTIANPGWFTETMVEKAPQALAEIEVLMEKVAAEITRRGA